MSLRTFGVFNLVLFAAAGTLGTVLVPGAGRREVWVVAFVAAAAVWLAAVALRHWYFRPLRELSRGARRITEGEFGAKVYPVGHGAVGELTRAFNVMSERLAGQIAQLEHDREQFRTILGGMVEGVVAIDAGQCVRFANDRAAALLDFHTPVVVGRKLWEVIRQRQLQELVEKALASREPTRAELDWKGPTERRLTLYVARLTEGPAGGAILVLNDTTELRRLEKLRQEFVANVSHELKTPLCVIQACAETLLDGAVDDKAHRGQFLEQIAEQSNRLQALILDMLSLTRIESGSEIFDFQAVNLAAAAAECVERQRSRAEVRRQKLVLAPPAAEADELAAWADPEALSHVLDNLVDNAVKYTPEGGTIRVRWSGEAEFVTLEVEDTGIGIPERDLPRIFERFYRVDKARSRELGGTGLGLSIVKHTTQLMRGQVRAASAVGRGSTFTVTLPRAG